MKLQTIQIRSRFIIGLFIGMAGIGFLVVPVDQLRFAAEDRFLHMIYAVSAIIFGLGSFFLEAGRVSGYNEVVYKLFRNEADQIALAKAEAAEEALDEARQHTTP